VSGPSAGGAGAGAGEPGAAGTPTELARQLRDAADRLMSGWTGATGAQPSALPSLPTPPATLSARQLQAVVDDIAARRSQVQALVAQLTTFDEQLAGLETSLRPLLQWLRTWSDLEGAVADFWTPRSGKK
jgi:hypothetical protein